MILAIIVALWLLMTLLCFWFIFYVLRLAEEMVLSGEDPSLRPNLIYAQTLLEHIGYHGTFIVALICWPWIFWIAIKSRAKELYYTWSR